MKILRISLAIIVVALASYGLITGTSGIILPYLMLLMGGMYLVIGVTEFQKRKPVAFTSFLVAGFSFFVGIYTI
ncbi:DUF3953 domain-containing protein [Alkalihalobacillus macyae]|uniref:DUF3953 domain-containing protein n=1 Tax=Guptibacillus hwajinpoensis TaxID=208199 RepID=UPI00273CD222|nr:DUF3953 domain-containing protein [Alkalihalobacillus macyae]MDP4552798.1 DUF3953 domain-containing protein [Alkalihalobacillus macyae]